MILKTRLTVGSALAISLLALSACTIGDVETSDDGPTIVTVTRSSSDDSAAAPSPTLEAAQENARESDPPVSAPAGNLAALADRTVYLDPGHAGTAPPAELTADDGRGGTKLCNTSGTASDDGWPEHTFTWEIGQQLRAILEDAGATVLLSRTDDVNRADCIDERTYKENASAADVVVSLHADGSGPGNTGFHISAVTDPLPQNLSEESSRLATTVRDTMVAAGLPTSNYLGVDGLNPRADLSGLNLSTKPKILIEFGNMRDLNDLAALRSPEGRQQRAQAVAEGIATYLA
jgi:N-acetylmuramoyl-L-alanine amidase